MSDPNKIRTDRKIERDPLPPEARRIRALEDIADTLEAFRKDFVAWKNQPSGR